MSTSILKKPIKKTDFSVYNRKIDPILLIEKCGNTTLCQKFQAMYMFSGRFECDDDESVVYYTSFFSHYFFLVESSKNDLSLIFSLDRWTYDINRIIGPMMEYCVSYKHILFCCCSFSSHLFGSCMTFVRR